ncbi:MAG: hypothetical protein ACKOA1_05555, partial [Bacteroidota bacterium]
MAKKKITNLNEDFDSKLFAIIARRYSYFLFLLMTLSLVIAYLYLRYSQPTYQSYAVLKIGSVNNATAVLNYQTAPLNEIMGMNQLAGDVELLRSKIMSHRVISKMPMAVSYFSRGNVLDNENYLGSPYTIEYVLLDSAIIGTKFELEFQENGAFTIEYPFKGQEIISDGKVNSWLTTSAIRLKVIVRDINQILQQQNRIKKNSYYFIINNPEDIVDEYSSKLLVTILNQSAQTVRIQVQDNNPYKASDFANTVMDEYNRYDRERKSEGSERSIDFINETILAIDSQLRASEVSLESFKKQNKVI